MSIISPDFFKGEITIPQTANYFENGGNIQDFIDEYEPIFLKELFGLKFYKEFSDGLKLNPIPEKWVELRDETDLKQMIAYFVYVKYKQDETTQSMGISEAKPITENANVTNSIDKQVRIWNKMVKMVRFFDLSTEKYPDFVRRYWGYYSRWFYGCEIPEIYYFTNTLGL